jgi:hypothetical protein
MDSDKVYSVEERLNALFPGPMTAFNPLSPGWSVLAPYTGAWASYDPLANRVRIDMLANITGATSGQVADGYQIAVMPAADSAGNNLLPAQTVTVDLTTDVIRTSAPGSPRMKIQPSGAIETFGISASGTVVACSASYPLAAM